MKETKISYLDGRGCEAGKMRIQYLTNLIIPIFRSTNSNSGKMSKIADLTTKSNKE